MKTIIIKRIYEPTSERDGYRILIDRLWPRGIKKEYAHIEEWDKDLAPTHELRQWFGHLPERFEAFEQRYIEELKTKSEELIRLKNILETQQICLLYGAKDEKHNQAVVLKSVLDSM